MWPNVSRRKRLLSFERLKRQAYVKILRLASRGYARSVGVRLKPGDSISITTTARGPQGGFYVTAAIEVCPGSRTNQSFSVVRRNI